MLVFHAGDTGSNPVRGTSRPVSETGHHATLRTSYSGFESWAGYFATSTNRSVAKSGHRARLGAGRSQVRILSFRLKQNTFGCGVIWEPAWPGTTRLSVRIRSPGLSTTRDTQPGRSTVKDAVLIRRRRRFDSFSGYLKLKPGDCHAAAASIETDTHSSYEVVV
jgi:hypothetical protein